VTGSWPFLLALLLYAAAGRLVLAVGGRARVPMFAALNLGTAAALYYRQLQPFAWWFLVYVALVALNHLLLTRLVRRTDALSWLPFFAPLALLVVTKYTNPLWSPLWTALHVPPKWQNLSVFFVGISYTAFRLSYLVIEVRNGRVPMPRLDEYLAFAFFVPTLVVGPISSFETFHTSLHQPAPVPVRLALERIIVGAAKYVFLGSILNMMAFDALLDRSLPATRLAVATAMVGYYLYLYCNFSGFCDVVIGVAGLMNLRVEENFDRPLSARNVKEFWNRWHMTLSRYMRDVVFTPLSKSTIRALDGRHTNHAIAVSITVVFLLVGIWHGVGWNFVVFGALQALGVVANHYYAIALKSRLGAKRFRRYLDNRLVHALAVASTFAYVAFSMTAFARSDWWSVMMDLFF
jgi:D-alanyl-lipoteichoic acid acyltransferase DltB (MBOAT superfamily)